MCVGHTLKINPLNRSCTDRLSAICRQPFEWPHTSRRPHVFNIPYFKHLFHSYNNQKNVTRFLFCHVVVRFIFEIKNVGVYIACYYVYAASSLASPSFSCCKDIPLIENHLLNFQMLKVVNRKLDFLSFKYRQLSFKSFSNMFFR